MTELRQLSRIIYIEREEIYYVHCMYTHETWTAFEFDEALTSLQTHRILKLEEDMELSRCTVNRGCPYMENVINAYRSS